jgi:hypothetical protein
MGDTCVNGRGLRLDCGASCVHDLPPLRVGQRLDGAAGPLHRPPTDKAWQWMAAVRWTVVVITEIHCAPEQYAFHNEAQLMSSAGPAKVRDSVRR